MESSLTWHHFLWMIQFPTCDTGGQTPGTNPPWWGWQTWPPSCCSCPLLCRSCGAFVELIFSSHFRYSPTIFSVTFEKIKSPEIFLKFLNFFCWEWFGPRSNWFNFPEVGVYSILKTEIYNVAKGKAISTLNSATSLMGMSFGAVAALLFIFWIIWCTFNGST